MSARAAALSKLALETGATVVALGEDELDDEAAWLRSALQREQAATGVKCLTVAELQPFPKIPAAEPGPTLTATRSRKSLDSIATFGQYQREWFAGVQERARNGEPFAVVNADAPQEILRALDVPFVVNQWWASIVAAKQSTKRFRKALADNDFPPRHETYNSQGIAAYLVPDDESPWGGLPRPDIVQAVRSNDAVVGIFEQWAALTGAELVLFERTTESRAQYPIEWWDRLPIEWDEALEAVRLDLMTQQLYDSIETISRRTGRTFEMNRLIEVLDLVNEQEEYYRRARDLVATTRPAPVGIADTMPATMIPQWHRGTVWGRDAAKASTKRCSSGSTKEPRPARGRSSG